MSTETTWTGPDLETVLTSFDTAFAWRYESVKEGLEDLYAKAKKSQWDAARELDWSLEVDPESEILPRFASQLMGYEPVAKLDTKQRARLAHAELALTLSNFLHGEQGAMIVASQLVSQVPWADAKLYASTQTMDEARHVEVFHRYLHDKLEWQWPINADLKELLDATIRDSRWDVKYLGMQVVIESVAMAAFGNLYQLAQEPLLKKLLWNVMRDESRHVAFGVLSLRDYYQDLSAGEQRDREDFLIWACEMMRNRFVLTEMADLMGWPREELRQSMLTSPVSRMARSTLFSRLVPNVKRLGLLTPRVREALVGMELIQFENMDPEFQEKLFGLDAPAAG
jgi:hypothetical protein